MLNTKRSRYRMAASLFYAPRHIACRLQRPALAVLDVEVLVQLRRVLDFQVGAVPLQALSGARSASTPSSTISVSGPA